MAELLEKIKCGSRKEFDEFYERYVHFVFQIALSILKNKADAEDICHDIFTEVFQKPHSYDPKRGTVHAWLAVKTRHRCFDYIKKKKPILKEKIDEFRESVESAEVHAIHKERRAAVKAALRQLPVEQRNTLYGTYFEERTQRELAQALNHPLGTIKSRIRYGLKNLRKHSPLLHWIRSDEGGKKNDW